MQLSLVFRSVLLLYLLALLLNGASSEKKSKRNRKSLYQKKGRWVTLDPSLNLSMIVPPSPNRSLSPWTYEDSYDSSRIPSKISEAKCEKAGCLTKNGEEDFGLESKPIYYQINVLKRVKDRKATHYTLQLETKVISLGCTCVQPVVVPQN
ncbi:interleukin 17a/f3 [Carassius auratus]|uniref:Interleukin 17a/f3 n=1 Tax=Carassius auratus TaxID=7957 RepID=A0A6P6RMG6_CARAU|nr:interleukin-17F-like [Carassius auratus]